jgi:hypothetical protein
MSTHFFIPVLSQVSTTVGSPELRPRHSFRPRRPVAPLAGVLPHAGRLLALQPTSPSYARRWALVAPAGERCGRPCLRPPPTSTSLVPAPPSSSVVAVELRTVPEGKSRASWRAPSKGTVVHGSEEPQAKRAKLPFLAASGPFRSRERDSREEAKPFVGRSLFFGPLWHNLRSSFGSCFWHSCAKGTQYMREILKSSKHMTNFCSKNVDQHFAAKMLTNILQQKC